MSGPLFAIFALPDHFPLVADRPWLRACAGWIYTPLSWIENHFGDRHLLSEYQYWWLRLMMVLVEVPQQS
jgi:hypothetical protein